MEELESMVGVQLTVEELVGRNFYHYTNGVRDSRQPFRLTLPDLELSENDDEDDDTFDDNADDESSDDEEDSAQVDSQSEDEDDQLAELLPERCWAKRFTSLEELGADTYLLYVLQLDDSMTVLQELAFLDEPATRSFFINFPICVDRAYSSVDMEFTPVEDLLMNERQALLAQRFLKDGFSFTEQRLPQAVLDRGGNGGKNTEYTDAIQSAHRLAYNHISIDTTPEGVVESFSYSSYASSGDGYADMFSRPQLLGDKYEEVVDMLLYILDQYTEGEYAQILAHAACTDGNETTMDN